mmetsp:Transcript_92510/g.169699  ORF Transcript_92510/g.169699 Transcript_92510/m.169699 type:complete len:95 (+) Transcript_92510:30-314(+)
MRASKSEKDMQKSLMQHALPPDFWEYTTASLSFPACGQAAIAGNMPLQASLLLLAAGQRLEAYNCTYKITQDSKTEVPNTLISTAMNATPDCWN